MLNVLRPAMCLLAAIFVLGSTQASRAFAQEQQQPAKEGRAVIVPINITKTIPTRGKTLVKNIKIENPAVARINVSYDAKSILITGLVAGRTKIRVEDTTGDVEIVDIIVQSDVEYLKYMIKRTVPTANVDPIPSANNVFILTGTVAKAEDIPIILATAQSIVGPGVVNGMRVGGVMQVQLDVVIAQVSRNEMRNMAFSFENTGRGWFLASALNPISAAAGANALAVNAATANLSGSSNLLFGGVDTGYGFFGFLQALRSEGLAKFLAEPRLVTLSGKPANFLSGGRLAVPEPSGLGTNAVRFEEFGTELSFLPIVKGNGKIYLEVSPSVNAVNQALGTSIGGTAVPGFNTQRLFASVELEAGQTFVIGGLIQNTVNGATTKVPVLGDIPFLNTLFTIKNFTQEETELLILVTPHLVDAVTCNQLPKHLPGQETRIPDDFELFLEGILEAPRGQRQVFHGMHYVPAYKNGQTGDMFPCHGGACGYHGCVNGGTCAGGNCGASGCSSCGRSVVSNRAVPTPQPQPQTLPAAAGTSPTITPTHYMESQNLPGYPRTVDNPESGGIQSQGPPVLMDAPVSGGVN